MQKKNNQRRPKIAISRTDFERLTKLATTLAERNPRAADELLAELDRARVVSDGWMREDIVQIGSTVHYRSTMGDARTDPGLSRRGRYFGRQDFGAHADRNRAARPFGRSIDDLGYTRRAGA